MLLHGVACVALPHARRQCPLLQCIPVSDQPAWNLMASLDVTCFLLPEPSQANERE